MITIAPEKAMLLLVRVNQSDGLFESERVVFFTVYGKKYSSIVDCEDIKDGRLCVFVVAKTKDEFVIRLPRETFTTGTSLIVPKDMIEFNTR
jgi:hypothetical protein